MNCVLQAETHSGDETRNFGCSLSASLPTPGLVLLIGELGAGKTTLTKGIVEARGAARADDVSSPTFTLIHEYGDPVSVYHIDLYRLDTADQVRRLGLEEILESKALVVIEWGERFPELWPLERTEVRLTNTGGDHRHIEVHLSQNAR